MKIAVPLSGSLRAKEATAGRKRRPRWGWMLLLVVAGAATALGGYLFWREVPDVYFLVGAALIVAAGLYVLFRTQPVTPLETEKV